MCKIHSFLCKTVILCKGWRGKFLGGAGNFFHNRVFQRTRIRGGKLKILTQPSCGFAPIYPLRAPAFPNPWEKEMHKELQIASLREGGAECIRGGRSKRAEANKVPCPDSKTSSVLSFDIPRHNALLICLVPRHLSRRGSVTPEKTFLREPWQLRWAFGREGKPLPYRLVGIVRLAVAIPSVGEAGVATAK